MNHQKLLNVRNNGKHIIDEPHNQNRDDNMSVAKSQEENLRAKEFEKLLEEETVYIENLMKPQEPEPKIRYMSVMADDEIKETGIALVRKAGFLVLRFNLLSENEKIGLIDRLMKYIEKFKNLLNKYGRKIGVDSFSITVGFPWGVSISVTFTPK